jgi:hypothetical protein
MEEESTNSKFSGKPYILSCASFYQQKQCNTGTVLWIPHGSIFSQTLNLCHVLFTEIRETMLLTLAIIKIDLTERRGHRDTVVN